MQWDFFQYCIQLNIILLFYDVFIVDQTVVHV